MHVGSCGDPGSRIGNIVAALRGAPAHKYDTVCDEHTHGTVRPLTDSPLITPHLDQSTPSPHIRTRGMHAVCYVDPTLCFSLCALETMAVSDRGSIAAARRGEPHTPRPVSLTGIQPLTRRSFFIPPTDPLRHAHIHTHKHTQIIRTSDGPVGLAGAMQTTTHYKPSIHLIISGDQTA